MRQSLIKVLLFTAFICSFLGCSVRNNNSQSGFNRLIVTSFNQYNQQVLSSYDSCFVVNSIENDIGDMGGGLMRTLYGVEILSYSIPSTDFSFAMLRRKHEAEWIFFGAFEKYILSHSRQADSAKLITIENENLNAVVNRLFSSALVSSDSFSLKNFLHELYYENAKGLYRPIFDEDVRVPNLREHLTQEQIDLLGKGDNLIVFKDDFWGLAIFKWDIVNDKIAIEQFVFPFGKNKFMGGLDVPPVFRDCDHLD